MVEIHTMFEGDLSCLATHGPSQSSLRTDAPIDNKGLGRTFSPTDLAATALATCAATTMAILCAEDDIELKGMRLSVRKIMSTDAPRRIVGLPMTIRVMGNPPPELQKKLEDAARRCPVAMSLHPEIETGISFSYGVAQG